MVYLLLNSQDIFLGEVAFLLQFLGIKEVQPNHK